MTAQSVVDALRNHATVAAALSVVLGPNSEALIIVPTGEGVDRYRSAGRQGLAALWSEHLESKSPTMQLPEDWRLAERLPTTPALTIDVARATNMVLSPLPRLPFVDAVITDDDDRVRYRLRVPLELAAFRGHFPSVPIVPGVEQIDWAISLARSHFRLGHFRRMSAVKFRRILQPPDELRLTLTWSQRTTTLQFTFERDFNECSGGKLIFDAADV